MRFCNFIFSSVFLVVTMSCISAAIAEDCPAPDAWFQKGGTPAPGNGEPTRGADCEFYQRSYQNFLFGTDEVDGIPRFLTSSYKTYSQIFGSDTAAGLLSGPETALVLAPRTIEHATTTDAEDLFQAGSNAILIDKNGHPIFYNIIVNPEYVKFIEDNKLNDPSGKELINIPASTELPVGVVEFKAAWQIISNSSDADHRIVVQAFVPWLRSDGNGKLLIDSSKPLRQVTAALIGLHVVFRTEGHPELIWATFEYGRNAPSLKGNPNPDNSVTNCINQAEPVNESVSDDGKPYALYTNGTEFKDTNKRPKLLSVIDLNSQLFSPTNNIVRAFPFSACFPGSNFNNAIKEIDPAVNFLNEDVRVKLGNDGRRVYSLVGATWLDEPNSPHEELAFSENHLFDDFQLGGENRLSSTSMESMTQIGSPNCFSCHDTTDKGLSSLGYEGKRINVSHIFRRAVLQYLKK